MGKGEKIDLNSLELRSDELRTFTEKDLNTVKRNIVRAPWMLRLRPILVDQVTRKIICGDMEYRALQELNYEQIPGEWVEFVDDMTEGEMEEMRIKDNLHYGDWDWMRLEQQYDIPELEEAGLDVFEGDEKMDYGDIFDRDGGDTAARMEQMEAEVKKALQLPVKEERHQYLVGKLNDMQDEGADVGRLFIEACERAIFKHRAAEEEE